MCVSLFQFRTLRLLGLPGALILVSFFVLLQSILQVLSTDYWAWGDCG